MRSLVAFAMLCACSSSDPRSPKGGGGAGGEPSGAAGDAAAGATGGESAVGGASGAAGQGDAGAGAGGDPSGAGGEGGGTGLPAACDAPGKTVIDCTADCVDYDGNTPEKCAGSCGFTGLSGRFPGGTRDSCSQCGTLSVGSRDQTVILDATDRSCETIGGHIYAFSVATERCARFTSGGVRLQFGEEPASNVACLIVKNVESEPLLVRVLSPKGEEAVWVRAEGGTLEGSKCSLSCP